MPLIPLAASSDGGLIHSCHVKIRNVMWPRIHKRGLIRSITRRCGLDTANTADTVPSPANYGRYKHLAAPTRLLSAFGTHRQLPSRPFAHHVTRRRRHVTCVCAPANSQVSHQTLRSRHRRPKQHRQLAELSYLYLNLYPLGLLPPTASILCSSMLHCTSPPPTQATITSGAHQHNTDK